MRSTTATRASLAWFPSPAARAWPASLAARVQETTPPYEDEGSTRESRGAVPVPGGAWWSVTLRVAVEGAEDRPPMASVRLVRHAGLAGVASEADVELLLPAAEVAAVSRLLVGVAAQGRRDGTLPE